MVVFGDAERPKVELTESNHPYGGGENALNPNWWTSGGWLRLTDDKHTFTEGNGCVHVHEFFFDGVRLPQTPSKFTISNSDNTEILTMNSGDPFTILRHDGPKVLEFEFKLTDKVYPFQWQTSDTKHSKDYWYGLFEKRKRDRQPIDVCILRVEYDQYFCPCVLTDFSFTEDAEDDDDWTVSVKLVEYYPQNNLELDTTVTHHLTKNRVNAGWRSGRV